MMMSGGRQMRLGVHFHPTGHQVAAWLPCSAPNTKARNRVKILARNSRDRDTSQEQARMTSTRSALGRPQ